MEKLNLYRITQGGRVIDTLERPPEGVPFTLLYRLIADAGKLLTNGLRLCPSVDIEPSELPRWREIDALKPGVQA